MTDKTTVPSVTAPAAETTPEPEKPRALYPVETALRPAFQAQADALEAALGLDRAARKTFNREFTETLEASGLDPYVLGHKLYDASVAARIADTRGEAAPTQEQIADANTALRQRVKDEFPEYDATTLIADARAYVEKHPKLAALLSERLIGANPDIVIAIVNHVRRQALTK